MPTLFISHASEDKDKFVRPLAEALQTAGINVWFDEYEIVVGHSLRGRIDHGLKTCDYGLVVISKAFMSKKWTQAELDGLFALEDANRKVILPVWYEVTLEEVREFSPMLAGIFSANGSKGVKAVVDEIQKALAFYSKAAKFAKTPESRIALLAATRNLLSQEKEQRARSTVEGVNLVREDYRVFCELLSAEAAVMNKDLDGSFFNVTGTPSTLFSVQGPIGVIVSVSLTGLAINGLADGHLTIRLGSQAIKPNGSNDYSLTSQTAFIPRLIDGAQVRWSKSVAPKTDDPFTAAELVDQIFGELARSVESLANKRARSR